MKCQHEWDKDKSGLMIPATGFLTYCKKCGEMYECDEKGKPHLIELLGRDKYDKYTMGDREIIKPIDKK